MPRNGSGTYALPSGNPVVSGTVISSADFNNTMTDLGTAITNSIAVDGQSAVIANITFSGYRAINVGITGINGSLGTPAINVGDSATGLYRTALNQIAVSCNGTQVFNALATGCAVTGTLGVSGNFAVATNKFTVVAATGNTTVAGTLVASNGLGVTGDVSLTGTISTIRSSGVILSAVSGGTSSMYTAFQNTSGSCVTGIEGSAGGGIFTGSTAYAAVIGSSTGNTEIAAANNIVGKFSSSGLAVTGGITTDQGASAYGGVRFSSGRSDSGSRDWAACTNYQVYGDWVLRVSNAKDGNPFSAGTTILSATSAGLAVTGTQTTTTSTNGYATSQFVNSSTGSSAVSRVSVGNNASADAGQIVVYGSNHSTLPNVMDINNANNAALRFLTNNTLGMTLDSSGNLLVGTTTDAGYKFRVAGGTSQFYVTGASSRCLDAYNSDTSGDNKFVDFYTEGTPALRGSITYNRGGGVVAYNTTSDYRAKDIDGPLENSGEVIDALKVYKGTMKGATIARPMLIAHEAQEHVPYAVNGQKDAVNDKGDPVYQTMDHQILVPLLIAEIQSLRARVTALEAA